MKRKIKYGIIVFVLLVFSTGCTTYLKDKDGKTLINDKTGQSLTENILCKPTDPDIIKMYEDNEYDLSELPSCVCSKKQKEEIKEDEATDEVSEKEEEKENKDGEGSLVCDDCTIGDIASEECKEFTITSGKYDGLWTAIFVKPLAWVILFFGKLTGNFGIGLIITTILIRLATYPLTKKSMEQSEKMKKIQPELNRLEKKYANAAKDDRDAMMAKSQEMMLIYKKYGVNPISGCLPAILQLPLLMAFLDAINRVPAIFEESFIGFHLGTSPRMGIASGSWIYVILMILVAVTTFFSFRNAQAGNDNANSDMMGQTKMMMNMFTVMIVVMSIFMSSALNIYWIVSNLFTLVQNYYVKRSMK